MQKRRLLYNCIILLSFFSLISCHSDKPGKPVVEQQEERFTVSVKPFKGKKAFLSAVYFNGKIICLQSDRRLLVLDTLLQVDDSLTKFLSKYKATDMCACKDTLFISVATKLYYLTKEFGMEKCGYNPFHSGFPFYVDSDYYVYAHSAGEFGGAVFFENIKSKKVYSYPATEVQQVFKFNNQYIISSYLAHHQGFSDYLIIDNPSTLYELSNDTQKYFANWYVDVDSLKDKHFSMQSYLPGVYFYKGAEGSATLCTFPYKGNLYSIYCKDSFVILGRHQQKQVIPIDTLMKREMEFYGTATYLNDNISATTYSYDWFKDNEDGVRNDFEYSGLIFRIGNKITFLVSGDSAVCK